MSCRSNEKLHQSLLGTYSHHHVTVHHTDGVLQSVTVRENRELQRKEMTSDQMTTDVFLLCSVHNVERFGSTSQERALAVIYV